MNRKLVTLYNVKQLRIKQSIQLITIKNRKLLSLFRYQPITSSSLKQNKSESANILPKPVTTICFFRALLRHSHSAIHDLLNTFFIQYWTSFSFHEYFEFFHRSFVIGLCLNRYGNRIFKVIPHKRHIAVRQVVEMLFLHHFRCNITCVLRP